MKTVNHFFDEYPYILTFLNDDQNWNYCLSKTFEDAHNFYKNKYPCDTTIRMKKYGDTEVKILLNDTFADDNIYAYFVVSSGKITECRSKMMMKINNINTMDFDQKLFYTKMISRQMYERPNIVLKQNKDFNNSRRTIINKVWKDDTHVYFVSYRAVKINTFIDKILKEDAKTKYIEKIKDHESFVITKDDIADGDDYVDFTIIHIDMKSMSKYSDEMCKFIGNIVLNL